MSDPPSPPFNAAVDTSTYNAAWRLNVLLVLVGTGTMVGSCALYLFCVCTRGGVRSRSGLSLIRRFRVGRRRPIDASDRNSSSRALALAALPDDLKRPDLRATELDIRAEWSELQQRLQPRRSIFSTPAQTQVTDEERERHHALTTSLGELTRAIPLRLLLDEDGIVSRGGGQDSSKKRKKIVPRKPLGASDFELSHPVKNMDIGVFVSHVWTTDPARTAEAIMLHVKLNAMLVTALAGQLLQIVVVGCHPFLSFPALLFAAFGPQMVLMSKSPRLLALLGKACVHQTDPGLTQIGLSLFAHYLQQSEEIWVLYTDAYLTRTWWLKMRPHGRINLIPVNHGRDVIANIPLGLNALSFLGALALFIAYFFGTLSWMSQGQWARENATSGEYEYTLDSKVAGLALPLGICAVPVCGFCLLACGVTGLEALQDYQKTRSQLEQFDVRKCHTRDAADKAFVLGKIEELFGSVQNFNEKVKLKMGRTIYSLMFWREAKLISMWVLICASWYAIIAWVSLYSADLVRSLIAPRTGAWASDEGTNGSNIAFLAIGAAWALALLCGIVGCIGLMRQFRRDYTPCGW